MADIVVDRPHTERSALDMQFRVNIQHENRLFLDAARGPHLIRTTEYNKFSSLYQTFYVSHPTILSHAFSIGGLIATYLTI